MCLYRTTIAVERVHLISVGQPGRDRTRQTSSNTITGRRDRAKTLGQGT